MGHLLWFLNQIWKFWYIFCCQAIILTLGDLNPYIKKYKKINKMTSNFPNIYCDKSCLFSAFEQKMYFNALTFCCLSIISLNSLNKGLLRLIHLWYLAILAFYTIKLICCHVFFKVWFFQSVSIQVSKLRFILRAHNKNYSLFLNGLRSDSKTACF